MIELTGPLPEFSPADLWALRQYAERETQRLNITDDYRLEMAHVISAAGFLLGLRARELKNWWAQEILPQTNG